jgi:hypothetical protein
VKYNFVRLQTSETKKLNIMSYLNGWMALSLEMAERVPRTEYSAEFRWGLVTAVSGIAVGPNSTENAKYEAQKAFRRGWDGLVWNVLITGDKLGTFRTRMGHARKQCPGFFIAVGNHIARRIALLKASCIMMGYTEIRIL